jgi:hypothetical protein
MYETIAPSRSLDLVPSKVAANGTAPLLDTVERPAFGRLDGKHREALRAGPGVDRTDDGLAGEVHDRHRAGPRVGDGRQRPAGAGHDRHPEGIGIGGGRV